MMSPKGRENFKHQLQQVVGSIQYTNDIDVHIALITAPSYAKEKAEKYFTRAKTNHQIMREYIDLFGFMQKNPNAIDIVIEEAKSVLRSWGALEPTFLLTNSKLTFQMTMLPENTEYVTQGPDGNKRLKAGPSIGSYRGLKVINSRSFSMEDGAPPRDVLRRRVRTAEYYRIPWSDDVESKHFSFYDESKDSWHKFSWKDLFRMAECPEADKRYDAEEDNLRIDSYTTKLPDRTGPDTGLGPNDKRLDMKIKKRIIEDMTNPEFLTNYRNTNVPVNNGGRESPWHTLRNLIRNANMVLPDLNNTPPWVDMDPPTIAAYWGIKNLDTQTCDSEEVQKAYRELASDIKDFILGNTMRMSVERRSIFLHLNFYGKMKEILEAMYKGGTVLKDTGGKNYNAKFGDGRDDGADAWLGAIKPIVPDRWEIVVIRPNIEHEMLGIVMGRGGVDELGATLWGQTELSGKFFYSPLW